jgi:hypothetical protein
MQGYFSFCQRLYSFSLHIYHGLSHDTVARKSKAKSTLIIATIETTFLYGSHLLYQFIHPFYVLITFEAFSYNNGKNFFIYRTNLNRFLPKQASSGLQHNCDIFHNMLEPSLPSLASINIIPRSQSNNKIELHNISNHNVVSA